MIEPTMPVAPDRAGRYLAQGYWNDRRLCDGLELSAAERPSEPAVADQHRSVTWAELASRVGEGVSLLRSRGVVPGQPVVLVTGNTVEGVIAYHSLLRAGASAVLLDRRCGPADLGAALDATGAKLSIAPTSASSLLGAAAVGDHLRLEMFAAVPGDGDRRWAEPDRDRVAAVFFTSGTTSRPKAVLHSINTLTSGARNFALTTGAGPATVVFLVSPLASITGVMQAHLAADYHATLVLEDDFEPAASLDHLNRVGATLLGGAPVIIERLVAAAEAHGTGLSLRTVALGGAMLPRPLLERITDDYGISVVRVYGSSEAPNATGSGPDDGPQRRLADDGMLMAGTEVRVGSHVDSQEGLLRGPNVFLGYLDPRDNDQSFEEDWYRTGDLVEVVDGRLSVVGRIKEVINRNGLKISPSEIDAALQGLPGALEWAAFSAPDDQTGERLAVAVVAAADSAVDLEAVVRHLRRAGVATRKLPEEVLIWDGPLPRTPSGKVVRSALADGTRVEKRYRSSRLT